VLKDGEIIGMPMITLPELVITTHATPCLLTRTPTQRASDSPAVRTWKVKMAIIIRPALRLGPERPERSCS
jgi:hypothetical protein